MRAAAPAPVSTVTSRPRPFNFLTVSGETATRVSPSRRSLRTASFIVLSVGTEDGQEDHDQADSDDRPFNELRETRPCLDVLADVHRAGLKIIGRIAVRGHVKTPVQAAGL